MAIASRNAAVRRAGCFAARVNDLSRAHQNRPGASSHLGRSAGPSRTMPLVALARLAVSMWHDRRSSHRPPDPAAVRPATETLADGRLRSRDRRSSRGPARGRGGQPDRRLPARVSRRRSRASARPWSPTSLADPAVARAVASGYRPALRRRRRARTPLARGARRSRRDATRAPALIVPSHHCGYAVRHGVARPSRAGCASIEDAIDALGAAPPTDARSAPQRTPR